jgi:hypothetical protein
MPPYIGPRVVYLTGSVQDGLHYQHYEHEEEKPLLRFIQVRQLTSLLTEDKKT